MVRGGEKEFIEKKLLSKCARNYEFIVLIVLCNVC